MFEIFALLSGFTGLSAAANCTDPRVRIPPTVTDLENFVRPEISIACGVLTNSTNGGIVSFPLQGYVFNAEIPNSSTSGLASPAGNVTLCVEAYNQIVDQCIVNQTFFGGSFAFQEQLYNLTNTLAPKNPILSGPGSSPTTTTSVIVFPTIVPTTTTTTSTTSSTVVAVGPVATAHQISDTVAAAALAIAALSAAPDAAAAAAALEAVNSALFGMGFCYLS